jgi:hypothetical protein
VGVKCELFAEIHALAADYNRRSDADNRDDCKDLEEIVLVDCYPRTASRRKLDFRIVPHIRSTSRCPSKRQMQSLVQRNRDAECGLFKADQGACVAKN